MDTYGKTYTYKMVLFGNEAVGKTSLVERFINNKFEEDYLSTLGYNAYQKQIIYQNFTISLMIFDVGGQEKFNALRKKYATGANTAFIIYDITNRNTFANVGAWKNELYQIAGGIPFIVIGNKADLQAERQVPTDEAAQMCSALGALSFFETSAKTGAGVEEAFQKLALKTYEFYVT